MIWPFTELERLRFDNGALRGGQERLLADLQGTQQAWAKDSAALQALNSELLAELEAAKKSSIPGGPFFTCQCGSHRFYAARHIAGWKAGPDGSVPVPLGGTVQCVDCGSIWHVDDSGIERAKPVKREQQQPPEGHKRRPPDSDADLQWTPGR